jgi:hypothetical protein
VTELALSTVTAVPVAGLTDPAELIRTFAGVPFVPAVAVRTAVVRAVSMTVWATAGAASVVRQVVASNRRIERIVPFRSAPHVRAAVRKGMTERNTGSLGHGRRSVLMAGR